MSRPTRRRCWKLAEASTGQLLDRGMLEDLPNLGRNPYILARLSEGVVWTGNPKFDRMEDQTGSSQLSIAGGPTRANNYTLDGIAITDSTNRAVIIPSQEAVEEVKVQANTYDAEMGRTGGGTFNTTLRSGSNRMHGSLFGTVQDTSWLANNFFAESSGAGQTRPAVQELRRFAGRSHPDSQSVRRPQQDILLHRYRRLPAIRRRQRNADGADRFGTHRRFFEESFESEERAAADHVRHDPLSTNLTTGARAPFVNNVIPTSQLSAIGLNLASFYPTPNGPTTYYTQPNYTYTVRTQDRADQGTFKLDHTFFPWLKASASYLHYGSTEPSNETFANSSSGDARPDHHLPARRRDSGQCDGYRESDDRVDGSLRPKPLS